MENLRRIATTSWTAICSLSFVVLMLSALPAEAKMKLITTGDNIKAYSGPGKYYRPLARLKAKTELVGANQTVKTRDGEFYRVIIKLSEKKSAIGFIPVDSNIRPLAGGVDAEDLEKFGEVALINKAVQASYSVYRDDLNMWTLGYIHYLSPGFYVKGFGGQMHAKNASGGVFAVEMGNDALLFGPISGLVSLAAGVFSPETDNTFFEGSKKLNGFAQAAFGLRYNIGGQVSVSAAATQATMFNQNNSFVTFGGLFTLEIGL